MKTKELGTVRTIITKMNEKNQIALLRPNALSQGLLRFSKFTI
jgi:hypothetical protein